MLRKTFVDRLESRTLLSGLSLSPYQVFGLVGRHNIAARYVESDGTMVTVILRGGSGTIIPDGSGAVGLSLSGTTPHSVLTVQARHGSGVADIDGIVTDGPVKTIQGKIKLSGLSDIGGSVRLLNVFTIQQATVVCGSLATLNVVHNVDGSSIIAGLSLGTDHELGGTGTAEDFAFPSKIGQVRVNGDVSSSTIAVGLDPVDGILFNGNDTVVGGPTNRIGNVSVRGFTNGIRIITTQQDLPITAGPGSVSTPSPDDVTGTWLGSIQNGTDPTTSLFEWDLVQGSSGTVTGIGWYEVLGGTVRTLENPSPVSGTFNSSDSELTLTISRPYDEHPVTFTMHVSPGTFMEGPSTDLSYPQEATAQRAL